MAQLREGRYRTGVIGVGRQGTFFTRAVVLNPAMELVAGCNRGKETLDLFSERFKVPGYQDYSEMLAKERLDIAVLVLPVKPNPEIVIACARAGVPGIVSEKPIVSRLSDLDSMVEECAKAGSRYQSGNVDRNYAEHWKARELIAAGQIGDVRSVHSYSNIVQGGCNALAWMKMFALGQFIRGKSGVDADAEWVVGHGTATPGATTTRGWRASAATYASRMVSRGTSTTSRPPSTGWR
ncbi:MAG: Gfo/Idh/MocA family oxidoreductase [SAR202 cluster bacterium]|nr:Gfo/Idh/MocA family oxidoreductase [SAR202 cluster bacterium]